MICLKRRKAVEAFAIYINDVPLRTGFGYLAVFVRSFTGGADNSLARPTSRCILFDGENISFDASLVIYI